MAALGFDVEVGGGDVHAVTLDCKKAMEEKGEAETGVLQADSDERGDDEVHAGSLFESR